MKKIMAVLLILSVMGCGAITRDQILQQKIIIRDAETRKPISNAIVSMNNVRIGSTDMKGLVLNSVENPDMADSFTLTVTHPQYSTITIPVTARPGAGYIAGGVAFFLLGVIPGVVSLAVDGATGTWYTYEKRIVLFMNAD